MVNKRERADLYLSFVVLFQVIVVSIQLLLPLLGIMSAEKAASFRVAVTVLTYLPAALIVFMRRPGALVLTFLVYAVILVVNYAFSPDSYVYLKSSAVYSLTPIVLLTALSVSSIRNLDCFNKALLLISRAAVFVALAFVLAYNFSPFKEDGSAYSMSFGYSMLLPSMFLFSRPKIIDKVLSLILFVLILLVGSRGPLLVLGLFYVFSTLFFSSAKQKKSLFLLLIIVILGVLILPQVIDLGSSRTLKMFQSEAFLSHDSGRGELQEIVINQIEAHPILGCGIGADRKYLDGLYPHNVFLELFLHYGVIIGLLVSIFFFAWCIRLFLSRRLRADKELRLMFIMLFLYGFVPLLVSGSYLTDFKAGIMVGWFIALQKGVIRKEKLTVYENRA